MKQKQHFLEEHDPERRDFQIERIILFSDAVFAIAITLLIIEIKPPEIEHSDTTKQMLLQLLRLLPKFAAFISSFFVIAIYWRSHHRIFGFVTEYSSKLIRINNYFLFTIVLMPFSSAYFSENFGFGVPFVFYNANVAITGFINYWFIKYIFKPNNGMVKHQPTPIFTRLFKARAVSTPIFFSCVGVLAILNINTTPFIYILIWPMFIILERVNRKNFNKASAASNL